jgi:cell division protein ZapE
MSLKSAFIKHCSKNNLQINTSQIIVINLLLKFSKKNKSNFLSQFFNKSKKNAFYLSGDVGVGKTMILDFFYNFSNMSKQRFHFNEFMIKFHDFRHEYEKKGKNNSIEIFVKELKAKSNLLYLDEFQVTNIVDAMILGKLFEIVFKEGINIIVSSNTQINDLYKDGLQREQFLPFIHLIKKFSVEHELVIDEDYRKVGLKKLERYFYPINEKTNFKINQLFRELTKNKTIEVKKILVKSRNFIINNYYKGIAKFNFDELCNKNLGGEDYIKIASLCDFVVIENIPYFSDENANTQQRFITLIDVFYEKRIPLLLSSVSELNKLGSSQRLESPFKRTISRIYELTSPNIQISKS